MIQQDYATQFKWERFCLLEGGYVRYWDVLPAKWEAFYE